MERRLTLFTLASLLLAGNASAQSISSYSGCKKLKGAAVAACNACVGGAGANSYQVGSGACGLAPGMTKWDGKFKTEKPPPKPTTMPKSHYVTVPAGSFRIGAPADEEGVRDSELSKATVTISRPFLMKSTEVTQAEWYFLMGKPTDSYDKKCGLECPVGYVSWRNALEYLNALSRKEGFELCYEFSSTLAEWTRGVECAGYRLPTEAEWEYAARGGTSVARYGEINDIAWYSETSGGEPHPAGRKAKNAYGLHDMLGSQWEWTWDIEDLNLIEGELSDPVIGGLSQGDEYKHRRVRGGSFRSTTFEVRAAARNQAPPGGPGALEFGFRPVRTVSAPKK